MIRKKTPITNPMMRGENTHHQDILMTPKSLRKKRIRKITPKSPIPPPELLLLIVDIN